MKKNIEQLMRKAEGALGKAFGQLDYAGSIARKLEAATAKPMPDEPFVELLIVRELIDRVERICNAAFIADARAAGPLPFPPRYHAVGMVAAKRGAPRKQARPRKRRK